MSEQELKTMDEEYTRHLQPKSGPVHRRVTETDLEVLRDYISEEMTHQELARKHGISQSAVLTALRLAALYQLGLLPKKRVDLSRADVVRLKGELPSLR